MHIRVAQDFKTYELVGETDEDGTEGGRADLGEVDGNDTPGTLHHELKHELRKRSGIECQLEYPDGKIKLARLTPPASRPDSVVGKTQAGMRQQQRRQAIIMARRRPIHCEQ